VGAHRFWKCALQNYLFALVLNALLAFSMTADRWVQFTYGLIGLAVLSPLIVGVNWFTRAATPKAA
jgi:intracellular septation protein A